MELLLRTLYNLDVEDILHLHSNMELLLLAFIYEIPSLVAVFTFQYGATSTQYLLIEGSTLNEFTFQYGATSTAIRGKWYIND